MILKRSKLKSQQTRDIDDAERRHNRQQSIRRSIVIRARKSFGCGNPIRVFVRPWGFSRLFTWASASEEPQAERHDTVSSPSSNIDDNNVDAGVANPSMLTTDPSSISRR